MRALLYSLCCLVTACQGGLAELWQAPVKAPRTTAAAAVQKIAGRMGVVISASVPRQVAPSPGERINVAESAPLGKALWLVRTRIPLSFTSESLRFPDGETLRPGVIDQALMLAPKATLGLRLDNQLQVLEDLQGLKRSGHVIACDGDAISSGMALRACLVLAAHRGQPRLEFRALVEPEVSQAAQDAGPPLAEQALRADAAVPDGGDGGGKP